MEGGKTLGGKTLGGKMLRYRQKLAKNWKGRKQRLHLYSIVFLISVGSSL